MRGTLGGGEHLEDQRIGETVLACECEVLRFVEPDVLAELPCHNLHHEGEGRHLVAARRRALPCRSDAEEGELVEDELPTMPDIVDTGVGGDTSVRHMGVSSSSQTCAQALRWQALVRLVLCV